MSNDHLSIYLNDHVAGSVAALELIDHLAASREGSDIARFLTGLYGEIEEDQSMLEDIVRMLGIEEKHARKAAAWITEKIARVKLRIDDHGDQELQLLQGLEGLALGIHGKLGLWLALAASLDQLRQLKAVDFGRLQQRARDQHNRVDARRIAQARVAFTS
jgi:hypothetical protein